MYAIALIVAIVIVQNCIATIDQKSRPNVILIVTDDQDVVLQGLFPMINTQNLLSLKGMTFLNSFTSSPICCPSRASILSGLYAHNHETKNNSVSGGCYGDFWKSHIEPNALPVIMQENNYETFFAGKYLNEYKEATVPPGWNHFFGLHGNSVYYNYTLTENGKIVSYSDEYLTDVLSNKLQDFINQNSRKSPFFAMITPPAPHAPYTPADRHKSTFIGTKALKTANFNMVSGPLDKHWLVASSKKIDEKLLEKMDTYYRMRWSALLAVDEMVKNIINILHVRNELDNTYIVYTSDNGYHIGQFAQPFDKRQPYETDIRVPFIVRGPNIPEKSISTHPVALIDLFPTLLEWAGIRLPGNEDGISFSLIPAKAKDTGYQNDVDYHRQILIEYWGEGNDKTFNPLCPGKRSDHLSLCSLEADCHCQDSLNNTYSCIRHFAYNTNKIYCEFIDHENFVEAYDLEIDPYQMNNLGFTMLPSERALYNLALKNLTICLGESCRRTKF